MGLAIVGVGLVGLIMAAFLWVPPAKGFAQPEAARILIFHVPAAFMCVLGFLMGGWFALRYLRKRQWLDEIRSVAANEVGFLFGLLATVTGMVFAAQQWGAAWHWDPRQTTILIQLLIYAAYFALRAALEEERQRASFSAGYALFATLTVPFLIFVLPRLMSGSLHPNTTLWSREGLDVAYRTTLYSGFLLYLMLTLLLFRLRVQLGLLEVKTRELVDRHHARPDHRMGWSLDLSPLPEQPAEKSTGQG